MNSIGKTVIGISASILITEGGIFPGLERTYVNHDYVKVLEKAGAVPLLLPVISNEEAIKAQVKQVDGILLSGGYDINPRYYGEQPHKELGFIFPEVDEHQIRVARIAENLGKPVFGICRGLQVLNVAFGGTLYQDISHIDSSYIKHSQNSKMYAAGHTVDIVQASLLEKILGKKTIETNSFHHQAVKDIAPGFRVNALSKDGVVEGIEKDGAFILGVQWHPEMMAESNQDAPTLFRAFVEACRKGEAEDHE